MATSPEHDRLVLASLRKMREHQMTNTRAAGVAGFQQPEQINGFIPDATGYYQQTFCVVEAETAQGLSDEHTEQQLKAFYRYVNINGGCLILSVSAPCEQMAKNLMLKLFGAVQNILVWAF
jgi:hypothetical protein